MVAPRGRCPVCQKEYATLLDHLRKRHSDLHWTDDMLVGTGFAACPCGAVVLKRADLAMHRVRAKCPEWKRLQNACLVPTTRTRTRRSENFSVEIQSTPATPPSVDPPTDAPPPSDPPIPDAHDPLLSPIDLEPTPATAPPAPQVSSAQLRAQTLSDLPSTRKPLFGRRAKAFADTAERLASSYNDNPTEDNLINFLGLPKLALYPGLQSGQNLTEALEKYPASLPPMPLRNTRPDTAEEPSSLSTTLDSVHRSVQSGLISRASRILTEDASVATIDDEVTQAMQNKHPRGPVEPFGQGNGPPSGTAPNEEALKQAFRTFKPDTAPGITGWTQPLLRLAFAREPVVRLLLNITIQIFQGSCPCQDILCSSRLIALRKNDGGLRPIAVGDIIYRLSMKTILKHTPINLLPYQFGVKTPGGVEPIVEAVNRARNSGTNDLQYVHCLDFSNAFNSLDRSTIAKAVKKHTPSLFRTTKWAYNKPSDLLLSDGQKTERLTSSQGVRQGDPLGPLLFSLGIRDTLERIVQMLGPQSIVLAYLDDVVIINNYPDTVKKVDELLNSGEIDAPIKMNVAKCKSTTIAEIETTGLDLLGTHVGGIESTQAFLRAKIDETLPGIQMLEGMEKQHALLVMRLSLQNKLRHLMRTLNPTAIYDLWASLDKQHWEAVSKIRSSPTRLDTDPELFSLPVKLGGLGILSYEECSVHAWESARASSSVLLQKIPSLEVLFSEDSDHLDPTALENIVPQRIRCHKAFLARQEKLFERLAPEQRHSIADNCSKVNRSWLSTFPFSPQSTLTGQEVAAGLHIRTLCPGNDVICQSCGKRNSPEHQDHCDGKRNVRLARHEVVKKALAKSIAVIPNTRVTLEPYVPNSQKRTDFKVSGTGATGGGNAEYDVTVVSINSVKSIRSTTREARIRELGYTDQGLGLVKTAHQDLQIVLADKEEAKKRKYSTVAASPFYPVAMSLGGTLGPGTRRVMEEWKGHMGKEAYSNFQRRLSIILLRGRTQFFTF